MLISPLVKAGRMIQEPKCSADQTVEWNTVSPGGAKVGDCPGPIPPPPPPWTPACGSALDKFCKSYKTKGGASCDGCLQDNSAALTAAGCTTTMAVAYCQPDTPPLNWNAKPQWEHSSLSGTLKNLFNLTGYL